MKNFVTTFLISQVSTFETNRGEPSHAFIPARASSVELKYVKMAKIYFREKMVLGRFDSSSQSHLKVTKILHFPSGRECRIVISFECDSPHWVRALKFGIATKFS